MNLESSRKYCLMKKGTAECFPFNDELLVFKVMDKIFCMANLNYPGSLFLKCLPENAIEYRERYDSVVPAYHMNKKHWNTVYFDGSLPKSLLLEMIDHSYDLVFKSLPGKIRAEVEQS